VTTVRHVAPARSEVERTRGARDAAAPVVLVVADEPLHAAELEAMLRTRPEWRVVVGRSADLARLLEDHEATALVLAPAPSRVTRVLEGLGRFVARPPVIVLSPTPHHVWSGRVRRAGVHAVLRGNATAEQLQAAIAGAAAGLIVLHPDALHPTPRTASPVPGAGETMALTPRELEILEMLAEGLSNRRLAARLGISSDTVKCHVASILAKLGAASRTEAVTLGVRRGLIAL
jgi:two-component system, NarL family, response regulator YdfI